MIDGLYRLPPSSRGDRNRLLVSAILVLVATYMLGASAAASRLAWALGYPPSLGMPAFPYSHALRTTVAALLPASAAFAAVIVQRRWLYLFPAAACMFLYTLAVTHPVYPPSAFWFARKALRAAPEWAPALHGAAVWGLSVGALPLLVAAPFFILKLRGLGDIGDVHGSARFATESDLRNANFIIDDPKARLSTSGALPLGTLTLGGRERLIRVAGDAHLLLVAPPGGGKTTALVIPTAQDWKGNLLVLDVKSEIYQATAGYRSACGSRILVHDPSRDDPTLARYNPMLVVRPYPDEVADVRELAQLVCPTPQSSDPFWSQSAQTLLQGVITHALYSRKEKTLAACYQMLCDPAQPIDELFEEMLATEHDPDGSYGWQTGKTHPVVATAARTFIDMTFNTRSGVIANAQAALQPYSDPVLAAATSTCDFSPADLLESSDRPVTLYLTIDPNSLLRLKEHIRIVISQISSALSRRMRPMEQRRPLLLLLDEFPTFGRMEVLERGLAFLRGYGVQAFIVCQHHGQLKAAYGPNEGVAPNCSVHIAFAPSELATAKALSEKAGMRTVTFNRSSVSGRGALIPSNHSSSEADTKRPLLGPDEIIRLPRERALVLRTHCPPIIVKTLPYYKDPARVSAAKIPAPPSEPTHPDLSHWTRREVAARPSSRGKRERRNPERRLLGQESLR